MMNRTMAHVIEQIKSENFPTLLREIAHPPKELYVQGTPPSEDAKVLAVVGSRKCTSYGRDVTDFLISGLRGYNISIVSGLALGIDGQAHKAALEACLHTVAVPGSGLSEKVLYPRAHVPLARHILESGGCLLSEYAPEQEAAPWTFPKRNRIMAGMAHAVLMIEATERSGTLITASLATEYNRELLVIPGSIFANSSKGTHQFLKLGATPVTTPVDILEALHMSTAQVEAAEISLSLSAVEQEVYDLLHEPLTKDELLEKLSCSATEANILLSKLELDGVIVERYGALRQA